MAESEMGKRRHEKDDEDDADWVGPLPSEAVKVKKRRDHMWTRPYHHKTRLAFRREEDISLLKEVLLNNPFQNGHTWESVLKGLKAAYVDRNFTVRSVRERCMHLLQVYKYELKPLLYRKGTEEQYEEMNRLLTKVVHLSKTTGFSIPDLPSRRQQAVRTALDRSRESKTKTSLRNAAHRAISPSHSTTSSSADCHEDVFEQIQAGIEAAGKDFAAEFPQGVSLFQDIEDFPPNNVSLHGESSESPSTSRDAKERVSHPVSIAESDHVHLAKKNVPESIQIEEIKLKRQGLELEKQKLHLEDRRFEAEQQERKRKWDFIESVHADLKELLEFSMNQLLTNR